MKKTLSTIVLMPLSRRLVMHFVKYVGIIHTKFRLIYADRIVTIIRISKYN